MSPGDRLCFLQWHAANIEDGFNLRTTLLDYCKNDVRILMRACTKFRGQLKNISQRVDPFTAASTIAKLSLSIYQAEFLRPDTIVNLPEGGMNKRGRQSYAALRYMRLLQVQRGWHIRTAEWSIGEASVEDTGFRLDGNVTNARAPDGREIAVEFYGCRYHGNCQIH